MYFSNLFFTLFSWITLESKINWIVRVATSDDCKYAEGIADEMAWSAAKRGTGIPRRPSSYIIDKINEGLAVIAVDPSTDNWAGFCCVEVWSHKRYIANSGLIVSPQYRNMGISKEIKFKLFELEREKYPQAKIFSLSTNAAVIHANHLLGFKVIPFDEVLKDAFFMKGAHNWVNYVELMTNGSHTGYVAMIAEPACVIEKQPNIQLRKYLHGKLKVLRKKKTENQLIPELVMNR